VVNNFKDFKIVTKSSGFIGDKIQISKLFNIEIKVLDYKIEKSKKRENSNYLTLQIERSGVKRIVFTGSTVLMEQINKVPKNGFPFDTTIVVKDNERYEFT